jgi:hypothetical protein
MAVSRRQRFILGGFLGLWLLASSSGVSAGTPDPYLCVGSVTACCDPADGVSLWSSSSGAEFTLCLEVGSDASTDVVADCASGEGNGDELCAWQMDLDSPAPDAMVIEGFTACPGTDVEISATAEDFASGSVSELSLAWLFDATALSAGSLQCIGTLELSWTAGSDPSSSAELDVEATSEGIQADMDSVSMDSGAILVPEPSQRLFWLSGCLFLLALLRRHRDRALGVALALGLLLASPPAEASGVGKVRSISRSTLSLPNGWSLGASLAAAGDLNEDGVEDLILSSPDYNSAAGAVLFLIMRRDGTVDEVVPFGSDQAELKSVLQSGDRFGAAVAVVGDIDGDGGVEVAVSAPGQRLFFLLTLSPRSPLSDRPVVKVMSQFQFAYPAYALEAIGDLDGDGVPDLVAGLPTASINCTNECGAIEILGFHADGTLKGAVTLGNGSLGQAGFSSGDHFGASLAFLGSLYGYSNAIELAVGAPGRKGAGHGSVEILSIDSQGNGMIQLSVDSGVARFPVANENLVNLGASLATLGDLDGDGDEELAIGAPGSGSQEEGAVAVVRLFSSSPKLEGGFVIEKIGLPSGVVGDSTKLGRSLAGGDADGDGRSEVWAGAYEVGGGGDGVVWQLPLGDADGDSVPDFVDNCPQMPNVLQTDTDSDGTGDKCDNCMRVANTGQSDADGDGKGDACEATVVRLIEDPDDLDEDRWRLEVDCGALGDADQLVVALTPVGGDVQDFAFGGPVGMSCEAPPVLCSNCTGCEGVSGNNPHLGYVLDTDASGAFRTDQYGSSAEVARSNLRPDSLYVTLFPQDDLCLEGETRHMGDLFWSPPSPRPAVRPHVKPVLSRVGELLPLMSKYDSLKDIKMVSERPAPACSTSGQQRTTRSARSTRSTTSSTSTSGVEAILLPLVTESDDLEEVDTFELCFTSDSYLLHRLTVAVKAPSFDITGDEIPDDHWVFWQDCEDGTTDEQMDCSVVDELYNANPEDSVYSSVDGSMSFAWRDTDPTHSTEDYLFLVVEGNMALSSPSLGALAPLLGDMQCVARLDVVPALDLSPCPEVGEPGYSADCSVEERLPTLIVPSEAEFFAEPDWCEEAPLLKDGQTYIPGIMESCIQPCGTLTDGVASTMDEDVDSDERRNEDDNCIYTANTAQVDSGGLEWLDSNLPEGIGDACQCGDTTGDGYIATSEDEDLAGLLSHLVSPDESIEGRCSVDDEGSCTIRDVVIHKRALGEASLPSEFESDQCEAFTGS